MKTEPGAQRPENTGGQSGTLRDNTPDGSLHVHGLRHSFGDLEVLAGIDLDVPAGGSLGIVGPSGCGKSTLLEICAGLVDVQTGTVAAGGRTRTAGRLRAAALMPQRDLLFPWLDALDNATLAMRNRGVPRDQARETARPLFERFGLAGFENAKPAELSGGMRQRVAFLRTLLADKPLLLLDEPFASLDTFSRAAMQEWLATTLETAATGDTPRTTILVTHDVEEALYLCDRVVVLSGRPTVIVAELESPGARRHPRTETVTSAAFASARQRALTALQGAFQGA